MKLRPGHVALGAVGLAVGAVAVLALREATLSTHQPVAPGSQTTVVIEVETHGGERGQTDREMAEAILLTCRLEVTSDLAGDIADRGEGIFHATLTPALDQTNQRQFRGCLEDWTIDQMLVDVVSLSSS